MEALGEWHVEGSMVRAHFPPVLELTGRYPAATVSTRSVPPRHIGNVAGQWHEYYIKGWTMTGEHLAPEIVDLSRTSPH